MRSACQQRVSKLFLIVDDHPLFGEALAPVCGAACANAVVVHASNLAEARAAISNRRFDVVLLDLCLPDTVDLEGLIEIHKMVPRQTIIVVISPLEDARVVAATLACGASGYIYKSLPRPLFVAAIRDIANGLPYMPPGADTSLSGRTKWVAERIDGLTLMQFRALMLLRRGKLNKQIAHDLDVSLATVKAHVCEVLRKFSVSSRTKVVVDSARLDLHQLAPGLTGIA